MSAKVKLFAPVYLIKHTWLFSRRNGLAQGQCTGKGTHKHDVYQTNSLPVRLFSINEKKRLTWKNALFSVSSVGTKSFDVYSSLLSQGDDHNSQTHDKQNKKWQNNSHE